MKFEIKNPDYRLSPYTGMTKEHWLDACEFLLDGIFSNLAGEEELPMCPRVEFEVSYPNESSSPTKAYAQRFEALARSFLIAAPLLHNRPDAVVRGIRVGDYYRRRILEAVTPGSKGYLLGFEELLSIARPGETTFQHTCECASLAIGLDQCREVIWDQLTGEERDRLAAYLLDFGRAKTEAHNWRLFNMLILGFLHREGYPVDRDQIRDHGRAILSYYAGQGWYRDGHRFDYYSPWAFEVYGPIWNAWYGYENEPYIAAKIEQYANEMAASYHSMFDREGHVTLWGRSALYRNAASSPYAALFLLRHPLASPGLSRWINSAALLQFITREDVFVNWVPSLGFYGQFLPAVQGYSCAESPFWIANSFVSLCLPDDHPFWTAAEERGDWDGLKADSFTETVMDGPGIVAVHQGGDGAAQFRTAKGLFAPGDEYIRYYVRLAFHSRYPWEDWDYEGAEAMQYSLKYDGRERALVPNIMMYSGVRLGVLYRKEYFDFVHNFQGGASLDLADFPVAQGLVRVDRMRIPERPFELTLGAYGFPTEEDGRETEISRRTAAYQVSVGETGTGETRTARAVIFKNGSRQLAFVVYSGWEELQVKTRSGVNPAAGKTYLAYGSLRRERYYEYRPYVLVSAVLTKESGEAWTGEELFPVAEIRFEDPEGFGGYGPVVLTMKDGRNITVDYEGIEGHLCI